MENAHVIDITKQTFQNADAFEGWNKWAKGSLVPMIMSNEAIMGIERWLSLEEKEFYRNTISIDYFRDVESFGKYTHSTEVEAYFKDFNISWSSNYEFSWQTVFLLIRHLKGIQTTPDAKGDTVDKSTRLKEFPDGNEPVMLLQGLGFSPDEWERYDAWVNEWGYTVYIPMLLKVPGVTEYDRWWLSNIRFRGLPPRPGITENPEYPQDLSIIFFENLKAYQNFRKSKELAAFDQNLGHAFPGGLNYKWKTTYRLMRRWSK